YSKPFGEPGVDRRLKPCSSLALLLPQLCQSCSGWRVREAWRSAAASAFLSAGTRHLMGFSPVQLRDRRVDLSFSRLCRPKLPACSLLSMTGAAGGADAPSLTFAARAGALVERPGRGNALRGGPNQRMWASAVGWRLRTREFPLPLPTRCSACGKRKPEVD